MLPPLKQKLSRILGLILTLPAGLVLSAAFFGANYTAWKASQGPVATAIVLSKSDELPHKGFVHTYRLQLAFALPAADSVKATAEVAHADFLALQPHDQIAVTYDLHNPQNVLLTSAHWFSWRSLPVLLLGLSLIWATTKVIKAKPK